MKVLKTLILGMLLGIATHAAAKDDDAKARAQAEQLLEAVNMEASFANLKQAMMRRELAANPQFEPYRDILDAYFDKHIGYAVMKGELAALYAQTFSADELRQIVKFYHTPAGKKALEKMPGLLNQGMQLSVQKIEQNAPELERMINQEALRRRAVLQQAVRQGEKMSAEKAAAEKVAAEKAASQGAAPAEDSAEPATDKQD